MDSADEKIEKEIGGEANEVRSGWQIGVAIVSGIFLCLFGFQHKLADLSLEFRLILVGVAGVILVVFVARLSHLRPKPKSRSKAAHLTLVAILGLVVLLSCAVSVAILFATVNFHNIRIIRRTGHTTSEGQIEVRPSHVPVTLTLFLSTPQSGPTLLDAQIGEAHFPIDHREIELLCVAVLEVECLVFVPKLGASQLSIELFLELVIELDTEHFATLAFDFSGGFLIKLEERRIMVGFLRFHEAGIDGLLLRHKTVASD